MTTSQRWMLQFAFYGALVAFLKTMLHDKQLYDLAQIMAEAFGN